MHHLSWSKLVLRKRLPTYQVFTTFWYRYFKKRCCPLFFYIFLFNNFFFSCCCFISTHRRFLTDFKKKVISSSAMCLLVILKLPKILQHLLVTSKFTGTKPRNLSVTTKYPFFHCVCLPIAPRWLIQFEWFLLCCVDDFNRLFQFNFILSLTSPAWQFPRLAYQTTPLNLGTAGCFPQRVGISCKEDTIDCVRWFYT